MKNATSVERSVLFERKVYSYSRFSTPEQRLGDSLRRQIQGAVKYAAELGIPFDTSLHLSDEGLSARTGAHKRHGALGRFLDLIKAGMIAEGSVLYVEDLDRLSREPIDDAWDTIVRGILKYRVSIKTATDYYTYESLNQPEKILSFILRLQIAAGESQKKADRLGETWKMKKQKARDSKKAISARCPSWLRKDGDRYLQVEHACEAVRMIFDSIATIGRTRIVRELNKGSWWKPAGRYGKEGVWSHSYVSKILNNRAVLGEYQPFTKRGNETRIPDGAPIPGFYPQIISNEQFASVQICIERNKAKNKGGRVGGAYNLLSMIAKCGYCGGSMHRVNKGPAVKGGIYLVCYNAARGNECKGNSMPYTEVEGLVLNCCSTIKPEQVLPSAEASQRECQAIRMSMEAMQLELENAKRWHTNILNGVKEANSADSRAVLLSQADDAAALQKKLGGDIQAAAEQLAKMEHSIASMRNWQADISKLLKLIRRPDAVTARLRLAYHLREVVQRVEIFGRGNVATGRDESENDPLTYIDALVHEHGIKLPERGMQKAFYRFVKERANSRYGRFIRINLSNAATPIQCAPSGSVAVGFSHFSDFRMHLTRPDLPSLWRMFIRFTKACHKPVNADPTLAVAPIPSSIRSAI